MSFKIETHLFKSESNAFLNLNELPKAKRGEGCEIIRKVFASG
jgi:hypothetical protein